MLIPLLTLMPVMVSAPAPPVRISALAPPVMVSAPVPPTKLLIVALDKALPPFKVSALVD
jgi:hypothetical protein